MVYKGLVHRSDRHGLRVASLVLGYWSPVRTGDARVGTLASEANVLVGTYISSALSIIEVTAYWSSGCSAIGGLEQCGPSRKGK